MVFTKQQIHEHVNFWTHHKQGKEVWLEPRARNKPPQQTKNNSGKYIAYRNQTRFFGKTNEITSADCNCGETATSSMIVIKKA